MQISTLHDVQLLMFVLIVPAVAMGLCFIFGILGLLLEVFKEKKIQTSKVMLIVSGCILIAWLLYTWKTGESTEANKALIRRLERDYRILEEKVSDLQIRRIE